MKYVGSWLLASAGLLWVGDSPSWSDMLAPHAERVARKPEPDPAIEPPPTPGPEPTFRDGLWFLRDDLEPPVEWYLTDLDQLRAHVGRVNRREVEPDVLLPGGAVLFGRDRRSR